MDLQLADTVALVTGGSRGIGAGIARALVREGGRVAIMGRSLQSLELIRDELGSACDIYVGDATDSRSSASVIAAIEAKHERLDILVTCVGSGSSVPPGQETAPEWMRVLHLNLLSATNVIEAAFPLLEKCAPSSIVCISSICGMEVFGAPVTYSAAKAALAMAVKSWSRPFAARGVRINVVSPGNIFVEGGTWDQKMMQDSLGVQRMLLTEVPMGRFGTPAEVADAVIFLSSRRASFITGANLVADGGQTRGA